MSSHHIASTSTCQPRRRMTSPEHCYVRLTCAGTGTTDKHRPLRARLRAMADRSWKYLPRSAASSDNGCEAILLTAVKGPQNGGAFLCGQQDAPGDIRVGRQD